MSHEHDGVPVLRQIGDELKLQAWLARAEFRNPSMHEDDAREEVRVLAQMRDELRLQLHLGRLEASDKWHALEDRWRALKQRAEHEAGDRVHDLLAQIRKGYNEIGHSD